MTKAKLQEEITFLRKIEKEWREEKLNLLKYIAKIEAELSELKFQRYISERSKDKK